MWTDKTVHDEEIKSADIVIYGLSFCDHCRDAKAFLDKLGVDFRFVQVDNLPKKKILAIKREIEPAGKKSILYPVLKINSDFLYGFDQSVWEKELVQRGYKLPVR